jgi:hypothetical protein
MLQRLDIQARGQRRTITFDPARPVTIVAANNGGGKSTALACLQLALQKGITVNGETVASAPKIFDHLSSGEPVRISAAFDCGTVAKALIRDAKGSVSSDWTFSAVPGGNAAEVAKAIGEEIGDLARVDVADLLSKGPTDRRKAVLNLCQKHAKPWSLSELREAFDAAAQQITGYDMDRPLFAFALDPALGLLGSCEAHAKAAHDAVGTVNARVKDLQKAIDKMAELNAANAVTGDATAMATRIRELDSEIARLSGEVEAIGAANRSAEVIARRLNELAQLPSVERARADVHAAAEAYAGAMADRGGMVAPVAPVESADAGELRKRIAEHDAIASRARYESDEAIKAGARLALNASDHSGDCPTCCRPMDDTARDALRRAIAALSKEQDATDKRASDAADMADCLRADLCDLDTYFERERNEYQDARAAYAGTIARLDADLNFKKRAHGEAEVMLSRCLKADAERADLRTQQAAIITGDAEMLRAQIDGAKHERAETTTRRDAVLSAEATRRAYQTHIADRDEATASIAGMKVTAAAWKDVVNQVAESAIAPFMDACNGALPAGWSMTFDLTDSDFKVTHPGISKPIGISNLCGRERIEGLAAMVIAMGVTCGNRWRGLWLDDCDRIADGKWDGTPGLFAAFVERMADACRRGLVHQVIMATSRRLDGAERAAIDRTGAVQVVEWGAVAYVESRIHEKDVAGPTVDVSGFEPLRLPIDADDANGDFGRSVREGMGMSVAEALSLESDTSKPMTDEQRIKRALKTGVSWEAMSDLHMQITGKSCAHLTSATVKRIVGEWLVANLDKRPIADIEAQIISTAARFPVKVRGASTQNEQEDAT